MFIQCQQNNTWKQTADLTEGKDVKEYHCCDVMTKNIVSVLEATNSVEIINILETKHLIRVPVVRNGKLVGIVARRDVLFSFIQASRKTPDIF